MLQVGSCEMLIFEIFYFAINFANEKFFKVNPCHVGCVQNPYFPKESDLM